MTRIRFKAKPTWHETGVQYANRPIIVAETPAALLMRLKRGRQVLKLPWNLAWMRAAMLAADSDRTAKIQRRRSVRRGALAAK